jgi:ribosomal protein S18 acetylase RimI-like enzyme
MIDAEWLSQVQIRLGREDDLPALEWQGEFIHFRKLYRQVYQNACDGKACIWVAELEQAGVIGQVFVQFISSRRELADGETRAYIYGFRVQPVYRSSGVGTQLLRQVEKDLQKRGFQSVTLNVSRQNLGAQRFYKRNGYQVVAAEAGRWSYTDHLGLRRDVDEPAWRMQKSLPVESIGS